MTLESIERLFNDYANEVIAILSETQNVVVKPQQNERLFALAGEYAKKTDLKLVGCPTCKYADCYENDADIWCNLLCEWRTWDFACNSGEKAS